MTGPRAREVHRRRAFAEVAPEVAVQKLAAVVAVETEQQEGQRRLDFEHPAARLPPIALPQDRQQFRIRRTTHFHRLRCGVFLP